MLNGEENSQGLQPGGHQQRSIELSGQNAQISLPSMTSLAHNEIYEQRETALKPANFVVPPQQQTMTSMSSNKSMAANTMKEGGGKQKEEIAIFECDIYKCNATFKTKFSL